MSAGCLQYWSKGRAGHTDSICALMPHKYLLFALVYLHDGASCDCRSPHSLPSVIAPCPSALCLVSCLYYVSEYFVRVSAAQMPPRKSLGNFLLFKPILFVIPPRCVPHYICSHSRLCLIHPRHLFPIRDIRSKSAHIRMKPAGNKGGK